MVKNYSRNPTTEKHAKASGADIKCSFKNTYECAKMMKGKTIEECQQYFNEVLAHKRCVPFTRFNGRIGRTAQAKEFKLTQGRWPEKSVKYLLSLLENLKSNAEGKQLDVKKLKIGHVQVNEAATGRRRTFRAHGRITPYLSHPFHIEIWAQEDGAKVAKPEKKNQVFSLKKIAKRKIHRLKEGGD